MIIFDNSVLSAFTRLKLLPYIKKLYPTVAISKEILMEYSLDWKDAIPTWIKILHSNEKIILKDIPLSLSPAD